MATTFVTADVHDPASGTNVPVEGIKGGAGLANPGGTNSVRQTVALGDGTDASTNVAAVDADQNLHVIEGRVATATSSQVAASASAVSLLAARATRVMTTIWNQSSAALYIGFANTVTAGNAGNAAWMVPGGGQWQMPQSLSYTGALWGIWDAPNDGQANITDF